MGEEEECREQQLLEVESLQAILGSSDHSHSGDGEATEIPGDASFQVRGDGTVREPFHLRCEVDVALPPNEVIDIVVVADSEEACGAYAEAVSPHSDSTSESRKSQPPLTLRGIKYLPPVTLHLVMPLTYPLVAPPELSFECVWFDAQATARVRTELVRMWDEVYQGGPVVFSWLEWLQYELVDRLLEEATSVNVREEEDKEGEKGKEAATGGAEAASEAGSRRRRLVLRGPPPSLPSTNNEEDYVDDTKTSTSSCTSSTWPTRFRLILAHAYVQASAAFLRGTHTCYICFEEHPGHSFVTLQCGHWWCRPCLTTMASTYVGEGGQHLQWLVCPRPDCAAEITPDILKHDLLSSEEYERWERLSLLQALDKMGDVARCPRCQTPCLTEGGKKEGGSEGGAVSGGAAAGDLGECPQCFFVFCPQCQDAYHAGTPCYSSEARLKQVEAEIARLMASSHGGKSLAPSQNARLEKLRRAAEESLSRKVVEKNARSCPACGMSVEKVEGCNKMRYARGYREVAASVVQRGGRVSHPPSVSPSVPPSLPPRAILDAFQFRHTVLHYFLPLSLPPPCP